MIEVSISIRGLFLVDDDVLVVRVDGGVGEGEVKEGSKVRL